MEEDDDELLEEIDIVLNSTLAKELCLFQFPLRPNFRSHSESQQPAKFQNLRMKPIHYKLCAELEVDKYSHQYDENYERNNEMNIKNPFRINLNAVKVPLQTNYAVGIYKDGKFHLTSIENMVQFRPTFQHVDDLHRKRMAQRKEEEEKDEPEPIASTDGEMIPLQVQYKKKETARAAAARKKLQLKKAEEEEPWSDLDYIASIQVESEKIREKLYQAPGKPISIDMHRNQYLDILNPVPPPSFSSNNSIVSLFTIQNMPIKDQIVALLRNANIMTFGSVLKLAIGWDNESQIIDLLEKDAILIRGCWIIKSSSCNDLKSKRSKAARDFLLLSFHSNEYVQRKDFNEKVGLHVDHAKDMLDKISLLEYEKGWKLKLPPDTDFMQKFPEVVTRQEVHWKEQKEVIKNELQKVLNEPAGSSRRQVGSKLVNSNNVDQSTKQAPSNTADGQLLGLLNETFKKYGVCNITLLKQILHRKQGEKGQGNLLSKVTENTFKTCLDSIAVLVQNVYLLKKLSNPTFDKYRNVIIKMFSSNISYTKDQIITACKEELKEDKAIAQSIFTKIMTEIAYESSPGKFILKDGSGSNVNEAKAKT
eukprot:TRINITY_DN4635_c0_g1_i4.p1 TRINITY_DN4635_c0_g1~~TRINITY_DN4635_c0_g1_i4.p1  ORF type:complete len:630 (-),score=151.80 TRINITY_DN4635_c0_g1_i4:194-1969(-)